VETKSETVQGNGEWVGSTVTAATAARAATAMPIVEPDLYVDRVVLANGGMGRVITARDRRLDRRVVIKELRYQTEHLRVRFEREVMLTARLEHPNIVGIHEAGRWPSGEPFYAMRLVAGQPLDQVISRASTFAERVALLPHVSAVADALAYAHERHVIHRDLKPQNVMVGEHGETVVIDWGLGKELGDAREETPATPSDGVPLDTVAGEILGTPAYMPPEQAEGLRADERSDVYAIGAILYHLLAGRPPYVGSTSVAIIAAVQDGPPVPLERLQPDVTPDLLAIVRRAMARDPADRYPTARGLADDLRRFQGGQLVGAHRYSIRQLVRRWLWRHRVPIAVAVVSAVALLVVGGLALHRIVREHAVAEARRAQAEDLVGFVLFDLHDKLAPIGRLDLMAALADKASAYYTHRPDGATDDDEDKRAIALAQLGDVLAGQGDSAAAAAKYRDALAIRERLAAAAPGAPDPARQLALAHYKLARALVSSDVSSAPEQYRDGLAIAAELVARDPGDAWSQHLLLVGDLGVGTVFGGQGDAARAAELYRDAVTIGESLVVRDPANAQWHRDLTNAHAYLGGALVELGRAADALAEQRVALTLATQLSDHYPTDRSVESELASRHSAVGDVLRVVGDASGALREYRLAHDILAQLVTVDPTNVLWQSSLAGTHCEIGDVLRTQGDDQGALAEFRESAAIRGRLPASVEPGAYATTHERLGGFLLDHGDPGGALAEFRSMLEVRRRLVASDPSAGVFQRDLSVGEDKVGDALLAQHDTKGALAMYRDSLATRTALVARAPANTSWLRDLSVAHSKIGDLLLETGDAAAAETEYRADLAIAERLAGADPHRAQWQMDLAASHNNLGDALVKKGDVAAAIDEYRADLAISEALAGRDPSNNEWQYDLSVTHMSLGDAFRGRGATADALGDYRAALEIRQQLVARDASNPEWRQGVTEVERAIASARASAPAPAGSDTSDK